MSVTDRAPNSTLRTMCSRGSLLTFGKTKVTIPTEADWRSEMWCLDIPNAYKNFFGKSLDDAFALFVENALRYQEDIAFMPLPCFRFYVHAYMSYLLSASSAHDSDGAGCFFGLVECRLADIQSSDSHLSQRVEEVLLRLRDHQEFYDAPETSYGSFRSKAQLGLKMLRPAPPRHEEA